MSEYDDIAGGLSEREQAAAITPVTGRTAEPSPRSESSPGTGQTGPSGATGRKMSHRSSPGSPSKKKVCSADVPTGTRCKICGEVHPTRQHAYAKIHVPEPDLDVKTDFKKERKP